MTIGKDGAWKQPTRLRLKVPEIEAIFLNYVWDKTGVRISLPDPAGGNYRLWITVPLEWVEEV